MDRVLNRECPKLQVCNPNEMYITEEFFLKDLLTVFQVTDTGKCELYDTSTSIAGSEFQTTKFSW